MSRRRPPNTGFTIWITGLSGSGKSTLAQLLAQRFHALGARAEVLDGDVVRTQLSRGLGFSKADRDENVRRIGFVCRRLSENGVVAIVAAISSYRAARNEVRMRISRFVEVHMDCPLAVLIARDPKGLYKKALAGEIEHFTGVSDPYEPPLNPEIRIDSSAEPPEESLNRVWARLEELLPHWNVPGPDLSPSRRFSRRSISRRNPSSGSTASFAASQ